MSAAFALLQSFVREASGLSLDADKRYLVEDRLRPVLRKANLASLDDLARSLHSSPYSDLARSVAETLTINETSFFRDRALFASLADRLIPDLIASRRATKRLRIWSAGCSTGQEPYSIAMMLDEQMRHLGGWQVDIVATDLSRSMIATAEQGIYSQFEVQRGLPVGKLLRYFHRHDDRWHISDYLRAKVGFQVHNLMSSCRDLGRFDIVLCRNVLIYFDVETKRRVLANLTDALQPDGLLVLGGAERAAGVSDVLHPDPRGPYVFSRGVAQALPPHVLPA